MAALAVACSPPPDQVCSHGEAVYYHAPSAPACPVADRVRAAAPCQTPPPTPTIDVIGHTFPCGGRLVHGCQDYTDLRVESVDLIPDEYGHLIWETCYGRSGEHTEADGKVAYDDDFSAWLAGVRQ